ncbi:helicase-exonuclease AddAB subunit AddA [Caldicellulosiruptoraceae bacterium PP1]
MSKWTNEQLEAINEKDCNILVSAAAGSGKTSVLVERVIQRITNVNDPIDIDRILIMTFTNAAASEMKERILKVLTEKIEENPQSDFLQRQISLIEKAYISTIHSFCLDVIRNNYHVLNIDPTFRVMDEMESKLMKLEVLKELFEDLYEKQDKDFIKLLDWFNIYKNDKRLQDIILSIHTFIQSFPYPDEWFERKLEELKRYQDSNYFEEDYLPIIINKLKDEIEDILKLEDIALSIINQNLELKKYKETFETDYNSILNLFSLLNSSCNWNEIHNSFQTINFGRLPIIRNIEDTKMQDKVKEIRDDIKKRIGKLKDKFFKFNLQDIQDQFKELFPVLNSLKNLVFMFSERFDKKKNMRSLIDFNDIEHLCLRILSEKIGNEIVPSDIAKRYKEQFEEIMVDEYQDSNIVQDMIVNLISRCDSDKPNVFMVGDVKQSIYRFRQASPELFLEKYKSYSTQKGEKTRKILLYKNFRSRKEIINAVNFIFSQIMSESAGEINYDDNEALILGANYPEIDNNNILYGGSVELFLIDDNALSNNIEESQDSNSKDEESNLPDETELEESIDNIQCEARLVAEQIKRLVSQDINGKYYHIFDKDKNEYRRVEYKDIVILLRTTANWADVFVDELTQRGIPVFADTGAGFFKTVEVQVMISLLQIIDNPLQDIPLLSVLRSPIASFTADELAELRILYPQEPLYYALAKLAKEGQSQLSQKASKFLLNLKRWRELAKYTPTDKLLDILFSQTGYFDMAGAMPNGQQRQANLKMLYEKAKQFEKTSYKGLFNFITFIGEIISKKGDTGSAKILSPNDNVVRIMSIHKSKGLEFPVVILAGCGKNFNLSDLNNSVLLHKELGIATDIVDTNLGVKMDSFYKQMIKEQLRKENISEELRLLYVALTRAREKLIIVGLAKNLSKCFENWIKKASTNEDKIKDYEVLTSKNYLDLIVPCLIRHKGLIDFREKLIEDFSGKLIDDSSIWDIRVCKKEDFLKQKEKDEKNNIDELLRNLEEKNNTSECSSEVTRRLNWEYPYIKVTEIPSKISVTELKRQFEVKSSDEVYYYGTSTLLEKPKFLENKKVSSAEIGSLYHLIMQHLDFSIDDASAQINNLLLKQIITQEQANLIDIEKINSFMKTSIYERMKSAKNIYREIPFNIDIPCADIFSNLKEDIYKNETILVQGVIDCYFEEDDGIILIDYKTDKVSMGNLGDSIEKIKEKYKLQIEYYSKALERLTQKKIKEKYIYLFSCDKLIEF